jgi:hypothetical protein
VGLICRAALFYGRTAWHLKMNGGHLLRGDLRSRSSAGLETLAEQRPAVQIPGGVGDPRFSPGVLRKTLAEQMDQVQPAQDDKRQDHIPVLVCLERAAQDVVSDLPDKVCLFLEVVGDYEVMSRVAKDG